MFQTLMKRKMGLTQDSIATLNILSEDRCVRSPSVEVNAPESPRKLISEIDIQTLKYVLPDCYSH